MASIAAGADGAEELQPLLHPLDYPSVLQRAIFCGDLAEAWAEAQALAENPLAEQYPELRLAEMVRETSDRALMPHSHGPGSEREAAIVRAHTGEHFMQHFSSFAAADLQTGQEPGLRAHGHAKNPLLQLPLWDPACQQEWSRADAVAKVARAAAFFKGESAAREALDAASEDACPARDLQLRGLAVTARLRTGRLAAVLQPYLTLRTMGRHEPRVAAALLRAVTHLEQHVMVLGPLGPMDLGYRPSAENTELLRLWSDERAHASAKQFRLVSERIAEVCLTVLPRAEALMLLEAARVIYSAECADLGKAAPAQCADLGNAALAGCLKTFERTEDMI